MAKGYEPRLSTIGSRTAKYLLGLEITHFFQKKLALVNLTDCFPNSFRILLSKFPVNYLVGQMRLIVPMVNETTLQTTGLELATFGEVLYAFSALRSTSGRRRAARAAGEMLPWGEALPGAALDVEIPPKPAKVMMPAPPRTEMPPQPRVVRTRRSSGRCQCGACRTCQENARWERIFQEKFANSDYYHHDIRIRYASPLSSV
ncbi:MAG TPA: hypothetical protein VMU80_06975 [Bryobacteraceae bacterium]|nr:hypothetical protein [Bryobacteraceae bacterium]